MQKSVALGALVCVLLSSTPAQAQSVGQVVPNELLERIADHYIVVFDDTVSQARIDARSGEIVAAVAGERTRVFKSALRGFSARMTAEQAARLQERFPEIAYVEPDGLMFANQAFSRRRPGSEQSEQIIPYGVPIVGGPFSGTTGRAWVIDTGIDLDHPDLNVDVDNSVNFARGFSPNDTNGHGTHVAGTIGAIDNEIGVVGVAPGALVVAVRSLGPFGTGSVSDVIAGVDFVAANADPSVDVANMSLGGGVSEALDDAVRAAADKGIRFALAAGNSGIDANNQSPGRVEHPNVWTVSASDENDEFARFSNFGNPPIECAAPGVSILSTYRNGGYATLSGTSMSSPHVAALLLVGTPLPGPTVTGDPDGNPDVVCRL